MVKKKYRSDMDIRLSVNGKNVYFNQGYWMNGERMPAELETTDEDIQHAVEHHSLYGNRIHCVDVENIGVNEFVEPKIIEEPIETTEVVDEPTNEVVEPVEEQTEEETNTITEFPDVTTVKEAMAILTAKPYEMKVSQCNTKDKVRSAEKKFRVSFPNI